MHYLLGNHRQDTTGRVFHYRVTYAQISEDCVYFSAILTEPCNGPWGSLERGGTVDGNLPLGPECVPIELAIRSRVLSHIETTDFGRWKPPPASWPGWYGPYL